MPKAAPPNRTRPAKTVSLSPSTWAEIDRHRKKHGGTASAAIDQIVQRYLALRERDESRATGSRRKLLPDAT